jgi:predicted dehydrogenase
VRVGIIGRGWGERVVAPAFDAVEGCTVVDVATARDGEAVANLCRRQDVDLISVHSPPFLHLEHVRLAAEAGRAVLCDKPFGRNAADAAAMCAAADAAGVPAFVNFQQRYDDGRQRIRQLIHDGAIGVPEHMRVTMLLATSRVPLRPYGWTADAHLGGGWLRALGSHFVDFVRWNFGEVVEASGQVRTVIAERPDPAGVLQSCTADDGFIAVLRTAQRVTAVVDSSSATPVNLTPTMSVTGSAGALEVIGERVVLHDADGSTEVFVPQPGVNSVAASQHTFAAVLCQALRDGVDVVTPADLPTFADGLACVEAMDRVIADSRSRRPPRQD